MCVRISLTPLPDSKELWGDIQNVMYSFIQKDLFVSLYTGCYLWFNPSTIARMLNNIPVFVNNYKCCWLIRIGRALTL